MVKSLELVLGARVPIIKLVDSMFGFHIDSCASNINGVLNTPRVTNILAHNPIVRPVLMFFKLFIWASDIDEPFTSGFGSTWILNFVHFGVQGQAEIKLLFKDPMFC